MCKRHAVLIFGQMRGDSETWYSIINNLIVPNNADLFVHSWLYDKDSIYIDAHEEFATNNNEYNTIRSVHVQRQNRTIEKMQQFLQYFSPKKMILDKQKIFNNDFYSDKKNTSLNIAADFQNVRSQSYSRKQVFQIMQQYELEYNFRYDYLYQIRSDIFINKQIRCDENLLHYNHFGSICMIDTLIYGDREVIEKISCFHDDALEIYKKNRSITPATNEVHMLNYARSLQLPLRNIGNFTDYAKFGDRGIKH